MKKVTDVNGARKRGDAAFDDWYMVYGNSHRRELRDFALDRRDFTTQCLEMGREVRCVLRPGTGSHRGRLLTKRWSGACYGSCGLF